MFLDVGIGILTAISASVFFDINITLGLVIFGVFFALLPDLDFLYFYPKKEDTKYDHKHRDYIHYPLLYLPIGSLIILIIFGKIWATVFLVASFFHFVHDSIGIGWGVKWLYPFSKNSYSFFYLYSKIRKKGLRKAVFIFNEENISSYVRKHGDANWVKNIYFKWHPIAIVELCFLIVSILILFLYVS